MENLCPKIVAIEFGNAIEKHFKQLINRLLQI